MRYAVKFKSSGIVAATFPSRALALLWAESNDLDPEGEPMGLFIVERIKRDAAHPTA
jgi:hypothetical protein